MFSFVRSLKKLSDAPDVKKTQTEFSFDSKAEGQVKASVFTSALYLFHDKRSNPPELALCAFSSRRPFRPTASDECKSHEIRPVCGSSSEKEKGQNVS